MTEIEIDAPIDAVSRLVTDFAGLDRWHPGVAALEVEGEGVGAVRTYVMGDDTFAERLEAVDEDGRGVVYSLVTSPLPVASLLGRYRISERGEKTRVQWIADLAVAPIVPATDLLDGPMVTAVTALQDAALTLLKAHLEAEHQHGQSLALR